MQTANHLVIPVGRPVLLHLTSRDVIHSFWVPSLNGKKDLLPGYSTTLALRAGRASRYTGECAEFCGYQHAHMSVDVSALPPVEFSRWQVAQLADAVPPADELRRRGREVYLTSTCRSCHTLRGTASAARTGPDLTHVASRPRLAAGSLPNGESGMAAWICGIATTLAFFMLAGLLAIVMRTQLARADSDLVGPDLYNQLFSMHGRAMMYLFAVPVIEAVALYLIPLMLGTRNVAFPRLNAYGYWIFLFGGLMSFTAFLLQDFWAQLITFTEVAALIGAGRAGVRGLRAVAAGPVDRAGAACLRHRHPGITDRVARSRASCAR